MLAGMCGSALLCGCSSNGSSPSSSSAGTSSRTGSPAAVQAPTAAEADALVRAEGFRHAGDLDKALAEFERVIDTNPLMTVAYMGAGDIYREQGDYTSAEARYAQAARLEPRNFDAHYYHALSLQLLNRVNDSVRAYLRALTIRPNDFDANLNLAAAYLQLNEPVQGLPYAQRTVALRPNSGPARANLAAVYAALNRHEAAVIEYQQAAELMELSPELLLNLADSLGFLDRHGEMASTLDQLLKIGPSPAAYERMGKAMFKLRRYDAAMDSFSRSIELDPSYYPAFNGLGVCHLNRYLWSEQKDTLARDQAMAALQRSLQIQPGQNRIIELVRRYGR